MVINGLGQVIRRFYIGSPIIGLQVQGYDFFVFHKNGKIVEMRSQDGRILNVYNTGIMTIKNRGSHYTDFCNIPKDIILFTNDLGSAVLSYNMSSQTLKVNLKSSNNVHSVTSGCVNGSVVYIVSEPRARKVHVYNATWSLLTSFGGQGSGYGQLDSPCAAVISDQGYIYVGDHNNYRVSMFTSDGQFVKHILTYEKPYYEQTHKPYSLSVRGRYLWVTTFHTNRLTRYIIY